MLNVKLFQRRRRSKQRLQQTGEIASSETYEKPELSAGPIDPTIAGSVKPKAELSTSGAKRKPVPELAHSPSTTRSATDTPWSHDSKGCIPPEFHDTVIVEAGGGTLKQREQQRLTHNADDLKTPSTTSRAVVSSSSPSQPPPLPSTAAEDLAKDADVVVQELGLVNMQKKTLTSDASAMGKPPEEMEGRKGTEYRRLIEREKELRDRLEEIEAERDVQ
jgi:hypothetical protein